MKINIKLTLSILFGIIGIIIFPIILGPLAIYFGYQLKKKDNNKLGMIGITLGVFAIIFNVVILILLNLSGTLLGTDYPLVVSSSESMSHNLENNLICGNWYENFENSFENYWNECKTEYENNNITREQFENFPLNNGFNEGDILIIKRVEELNVGDVILFGSGSQPIAHRIIRIWKEDGKVYYQTKGDHNSRSITGLMGETKITEELILGKVVAKIPYLGWVKIGYTKI